MMAMLQGQGYIDAWSEKPLAIAGGNRVRETFTVSGPLAQHDRDLH